MQVHWLEQPTGALCHDCQVMACFGSPERSLLPLQSQEDGPHVKGLSM